LTYDATKLLGSPVGTMSVMAAESISDSEPISLEQAKAHLRQPFDDDNDYISALIVAARQMAEGRLNRTLKQRTLRAGFDLMSSSYTLRKPPIISVDSVKLMDVYGNETAVDATDYRVSTYFEPGMLVGAPGSTWSNSVRSGSVLIVEYTAGYDAAQVPQPIIQWMLLAIGTMYENRETMSAGVQIYDMPADFMSWLLQPYMVYE
jgi:uncharacterized phiE125 gp8 family phage protein